MKAVKTVSVVLELTSEEVKLLRDISALDLTIPKALKPADAVRQAQVTTFLRSLQTLLAE